jgi:hypothetical protein
MKSASRSGQQSSGKAYVSTDLPSLITPVQRLMVAVCESHDSWGSPPSPAGCSKLQGHWVFPSSSLSNGVSAARVALCLYLPRSAETLIGVSTVRSNEQAGHPVHVRLVSRLWDCSRVVPAPLVYRLALCFGLSRVHHLYLSGQTSQPPDFQSENSMLIIS